MPRESLDDWIERHVALGLLVTAGARMEEILRDCFCMLDGGEHADVVAAGRDVSWLIEYCGDLAEANPLITQASKDAIGAALTVCKAASQHRNELIHGVHFFFGSTSLWASGWGWVHRSRRHKPELVKEWTLSEIHGVWRELCVATDEIDQAVSEAVGHRGALWARRARRRSMQTANRGPAGERDASEPGRGTPGRVPAQPRLLECAAATAHVTDR